MNFANNEYTEEGQKGQIIEHLFPKEMWEMYDLQITIAGPTQYNL